MATVVQDSLLVTGDIEAKVADIGGVWTAANGAGTILTDAALGAYANGANNRFARLFDTPIAPGAFDILGRIRSSNSTAAWAVGYGLYNVTGEVFRIQAVRLSGTITVQEVTAAGLVALFSFANTNNTEYDMDVSYDGSQYTVSIDGVPSGPYTPAVMPIDPTFFELRVSNSGSGAANRCYAQLVQFDTAAPVPPTEFWEALVGTSQA